MPYNPKSVLRQVPNGILQKFFSRHDEFATFDWASIKETRIDPVFETWQRMPEDRRKQVSGVIHRWPILVAPPCWSRQQARKVSTLRMPFGR